MYIFLITLASRGLFFQRAQKWNFALYWRKYIMCARNCRFMNLSNEICIVYMWTEWKTSYRNKLCSVCLYYIRRYTALVYWKILRSCIFWYICRLFEFPLNSVWYRNRNEAAGKYELSCWIKSLFYFNAFIFKSIIIWKYKINSFSRFFLDFFKTFFNKTSFYSKSVAFYIKKD